MTCERSYTPAVVAEMQNISLAVELRRRLQDRIDRYKASLSINGDAHGDYGAGFLNGIAIAVAILDELAPVNPAE